MAKKIKEDMFDDIFCKDLNGKIDVEKSLVQIKEKTTEIKNETNVLFAKAERISKAADYLEITYQVQKILPKD
jgi:hypothetical protein